MTALEFMLRASLVLGALTTAGPAWSQCYPVPGGPLDPGGVADGARLGASVALDGELALVGAPGDDWAGAGSGAAYLFAWNGFAWDLVARLTASDGAAGQLFGTSVALSGEHAVIGAPGDDELGPGAGAAYAFQLVAGQGWIESLKLTPTGGAGAQCGQAVDVAADLLVLGCPGSESAQLYRSSTDAWALDAVLQGDAGLSGFGRSIATDGERVLVGAAFSTTEQLGFARVFESAAGPWVATATVGEGSNGSHSDVDIHGDRLVVGRPEGAENTVGHADFYDRTGGGGWLLRETVTRSWAGAPFCYLGPAFGASVSLSGDRAIVAEPNFSTAFRCGFGAARFFRDDGVAWTEVWTQAAPIQGYNGLYSFSRSVAIDGELALVGDPLTAGAAGACHSLTTITSEVYCTAKPTTLSGCVTSLSASGAPSASNPGAFQIQAGPTPGEQLGIFLWGHQGKANIPFQGGYLCVQPPVLRSTARPSGGTLGTCSGSYSLQLSELAAHDPGFGPGAYLAVQLWFRDPGNLFSSALSNGLAFVACP